MKDAIADLLLEEASLLDERRYADWLGLYTDDAVYWVPTQPGQRSPHESLSLFYETRELLAMRVARLEKGEAHFQDPPSRTVHHVAGIRVAACAEARWTQEARSTLMLAEWRLGESRWFAARVLHGLRQEAGAWRIAFKRVDLVDSEAPHRALGLPF